MFALQDRKSSSSVLERGRASPAGKFDAGVLAALDRVMAVIEFTPSGEILSANANFLTAMGYSLDEIRGRHHRMFAPPGLANSEDYRRFWESLGRGEFLSGEFKRVAKGGGEVWIQASYNPIADKAGRVVRIVKFATVITDAKNKAVDSSGQIDAINRSQAVITFSPDGAILNANDNFCMALGYSIGEIKGQHHRMFVGPAEAGSPAYAQLWDNLRRGEYQAGEYRRIAKGGRVIYIQATYNPIIDANGKVAKVVKFATDITKTVEARQRNEKLAVDIEKDIAAIVSNVGSVSQQTSGVSVASGETSSTIQSAAAATEELSASINEISASVAASKGSADRALELTHTADKQTAALTRTADQMSGIVELIDAIASQINLLALNATIESARAGEAGRGFAVVAAEVKQLAAQVTSATKTISGEIRDVQNVSAEVVTSLRAIQSSVREITGNFSSVAAAVEEQSAATAEISSTMQTASLSIGSINDLVGNMAASADQARASATRAAEQVRANIQAMVG
jgi:methyl-accepting chemotaxis protein